MSYEKQGEKKKHLGKQGPTLGTLEFTNGTPG